MVEGEDILCLHKLCYKYTVLAHSPIFVWKLYYDHTNLYVVVQT